jgi:two-component SAPR family response regulator
LTTEEVHALSSIARHGVNAVPTEECDIDLITDAEVVQVLRAVERPSPSGSAQPIQVAAEWAAVVQVFGYPQVMSNNGGLATFRKKRSLELLTWLSLNRDRSRRSAARTALWDIDVNDSSFSTIVSDMRRGLVELTPAVSRDEWVPVTFTDLIPLSERVVTDAELLHDALEKFRNNEENIEELLTYLGWIRDVPFAGTSYSWADLDGTTTRLVILAMNAAREVAQWAAVNNHPRARDVAVSAGLRVMPGDEELIAVLAC